MQPSSPLPDVDTSSVSTNGHATVLSVIEEQRHTTVWVSRITTLIGLVCLAAALILWAARQHHYRPVLALLTVAMFAAILHSYTFDDGE